MPKTAIGLALLAAAGLSTAQEMGQVISATPIVQQVAVPQQSCYQETVMPAPHHSNGGGAVLGAVVGGLLGSALGSGSSGRSAAAMVGAFGGAIAGEEAGLVHRLAALRDLRFQRLDARGQQFQFALVLVAEVLLSRGGRRGGRHRGSGGGDRRGRGRG